MRIIISCLAGAGMIFLMSCKEEVTAPLPSTEFNVKVSVKDLDGNPVSGLRISTWNHLSISVGGTTKNLSGTLPARSTSAIRFGLMDVSTVTLSVLEFDGSPVSTLLSQTMPAGLYTVVWQLQIQKPTRVYNYRLVAQDTASGSTLFRDSLYAVLWQPDANVSILGWTAQDGIFETNDKLLFPNTLALPPLVHTEESGPDSISAFTIRDTVTIVLTDTSANRQMTFVRVMNNDVANDIQLVWNPPMAKQWFPENYLARERQVRVVPRRLATGVIDWMLYQNYPHPFN